MCGQEVAGDNGEALLEGFGWDPQVAYPFTFTAPQVMLSLSASQPVRGTISGEFTPGK